MIWKSCELKKKTGQEKDALGNLVGGTWETVRKTKCRFTPWTDEQIAVEERKVTQNEQQFAIPIPYQKFPECTHAAIDAGTPQEITKMDDLSPRWTLIRVRIAKE